MPDCPGVEAAFSVPCSQSGEQESDDPARPMVNEPVQFTRESAYASCAKLFSPGSPPVYSGLGVQQLPIHDEGANPSALIAERKSRLDGSWPRQK